MADLDHSRHARVRRRRGRSARLLGAGLLAALTTALTTFVFAGTAAADTITFTGQGTNADGTCKTFEGQPPPAGGTQTWQFNLTGTQPGATMSASFSDGTTVTDKPEDDHNGNTSFWFIVTDAGASLQSASATFTPVENGNPQFVVSHCTAGGEKPPPPTTAPPTSAPPTTAPPAAVSVVSVPVFTG